MAETLFVFRPEPGLRVTLETARSMDLDAVGCPLFSVEPVQWDLPAVSRFDRLLAGSANAFRHAGEKLDKLAKLPVLAVGEATMEEAKDRGFMVARTGTGGLQNLIDGMKGKQRQLLRLAGEAHVELDPPEGIEIETVVVYKTIPRDITDEVAVKLRAGGVALLHSGEAAKRLASECERLEISKSLVAIAALAPRIAEAAGDGWRDVHVAPHPIDGELLELAEELCQRS